MLDCLIIGGGPAGLTAAVYLARFHLRVTVIDEGKSRALLIPQSHNIPGFADGIAGHEIVSRMREHARLYGATIVKGRVDAIRSTSAGFMIDLFGESVSTRAVLLATGVANRRPPLCERDHAEALRRGYLRYCPVCDGYEVSGKKVGVIGGDEKAAAEAEFLRSFTDRVTIISPTGHECDPDLRRRLEKIGVTMRLGPIVSVELRSTGLEVLTAAGSEIHDSVYPALGSSIHSNLAKTLGAAIKEDGCIEVDRHQRTTVSHLYAAGDVVFGLDQISVCNGQAAIAGVAIRNDLSEEQQLLWPRGADGRNRPSAGGFAADG